MNKYLLFGAKIAKISSVDPDRDNWAPSDHLKKEKNKEIVASKIFSRVGKFAEQAKNLISRSSLRVIIVVLLQQLYFSSV